MPDADETIITQLIIDTSNFIAGVEQSRSEMESLKLELRTLAVEGKQAVADIGAELIKLAEIQKEALKAELPTGKGAKDLPEYQEVTEQINELTQHIKNLRQATREAQKEETEYFKLSLQSLKERKKAVQDQSKSEQDAIKRLIAARNEYSKITRQGYGVMSSAAQQYEKTVNRTAQIIQSTAERSGQSFQQVAQRMVGLGTPINQVNDALKQLQVQANQSKEATIKFLEAMRGIHQATQPIQGGIRGLISTLSNFGGVGKYVFGSILGVTAITVLRNATRAFVDFAKEILRRGEEMSDIMFTFQVAIRGLQRVGLDTTMDEWTESIQNLKDEFPFFPKREFVEATNLAALMTREFGFTAAEIENVVRMSSILSQITGKDLLESVRGITYAIGSGYFESLQRAGINISRQVVANEALAQGYKGVYNELEPTVRAAVTYSVIQNNLNAIQDDAAYKVNTYAGQVQILYSTFEDLKNLFAEVVTGSDSVIETLRTINDVLGSIQKVYEAIAGLNIDIFAGFKAFTGLDKITGSVGKLVEYLDALANTIEALGVVAGAVGNVLGAFETTLRAFGFVNLPNLIADIKNELFNLQQGLQDIANEEIDPKIFKLGEFEFSEEEYQEITEATQQLVEEVNDIVEEGEQRKLDIAEKYLQDMMKLRQDYYGRLADLEQKFYDRLDDIATKAAQQGADATADYEFRVSEAIRDAAFRRSEAERKYREREIKEEQRFQEKLRKLREDFLFNLEDAVRERDARQIIRLTRQYNLRREQMIRDEKLSKKDREDAFQEELRQIEIQKQERLRQLAIEHQRRLEEIALQAERERQQAEIEWQRQQEREKERYDDAKIARKERRDDQLAGIDEATQERINKILTGLQDEYDLTEEQLDAIAFLWEYTYGPNGRIDTAVQYTIDRISQLMQWMNILREQQQALRFANIPSGGYLGPPPANAGGQAEGGIIIARKPTVALFGEAGPEMAQFTPLNQLGSQGSFGQMPMSNKESPMGRLALQLLLSPDLEARIIDSTLNEVADVVFTIERERA